MVAVPKKAADPLLDGERLDALQSAVAGFDRECLLWASGYLAAMAAMELATEHSPEPHRVAAAATADWSVFYATETGNSRRVAESLAERSRGLGLVVDVHDLRDYRPRSFSKVANALFIVATHGIGEAPDGSELFFEYWFSNKAPRLEHLDYSILALGDSSYADFCEMGKLLDTRLQELGATAVVKRVDCDLDFDVSAATWADQVIRHSPEQPDAGGSTSGPYLRTVTQAPSFTRERPFSAEILSTQRITGSGSSKDVQHIELSLAGSGLTYLPGDSLGVHPENPAELVSELLHSLKLDGAEPVTVNGDSVRFSDALTRHKEITVLSRPLLDAVSTGQEKLCRILDDRDKLTAFFNSRQVIDVIADYPRTWQAQEFVDSLRKLTPRLYSVASSPDVDPDEAHLTVAVVRYEEHGRRHWGSASNYLISGADRVPVYIEPNDHFRLPPDSDTPIIMIGAGTGIAPYRAFIEHRVEHGHTGDNWLIYGDRTLSNDFLYQLEWLRYRKLGSLKHLDVAFSRDQQHKIYVQQRVLERAKRLYSWLERGAHIYVCGDAERMAGDVDQALLRVLQTEGGLNDERSTQYLRELKSAHRYKRDVY